MNHEYKVLGPYKLRKQIVDGALINNNTDILEHTTVCCVPVTMLCTVCTLFYSLNSPVRQIISILQFRRPRIRVGSRTLSKAMWMG